MVKEGKFRANLYYRLHVLPVNIPPLRERNEDILPLLHFYLQKYNQIFNQTRTFSKKTLDVLQRYQWPGNIRELENIVEQLVIMAKKEEISIHDLPERFLSVSMEKEALESLKQGNNLGEIIESMEKTIIEQAIKENKTTRKTAKVLGITQTSLIRRLKNTISATKKNSVFVLGVLI